MSEFADLVSSGSSSSSGGDDDDDGGGFSGGGGGDSFGDIAGEFSSSGSSGSSDGGGSFYENDWGGAGAFNWDSGSSSSGAPDPVESSFELPEGYTLEPIEEEETDSSMPESLKDMTPDEIEKLSKAYGVPSSSPSYALIQDAKAYMAEMAANGGEMPGEWVAPPAGVFAGLTQTQAVETFRKLQTELDDPEVTPQRRAEILIDIGGPELTESLDYLDEVAASSQEDKVWVPRAQEDQIKLLQGIVLMESFDDDESKEYAKALKEELSRDGTIDDSLWEVMGVEKPDTSESRTSKVMGAIFGAADYATKGAFSSLLQIGDRPSQHVLYAIAASGRTPGTGAELSGSQFWGGVGRGFAEMIPGVDTGDYGGAIDQNEDGSLNFREAIGADYDAGGRVAGAFDSLLVGLTDPTSYVGFGVGQAANVGLDVVEQTFGREAMKQVRRQGMKKALSEAQQDVLFDVIRNNADEAILGGSRRGAKIGGDRFAQEQFSNLARGGKQGLRVAGFTLPGTSTAGVTQGVSAVIDGNRVLSGARSAANATRNVISPRNRIRATLGHFKATKVYQARVATDSAAANEINQMEMRLNGLRSRAVGVRGLRRGEMTDIELDRLMTTGMDDLDMADATIKKQLDKGNVKTARFLNVYKEYATMASFPDEVMQIIDTVREYPGVLDDVARTEVIDELQSLYPRTRVEWEQVLDRPYWIPGMEQDEWERAFRADGALDDFLEQANDIVTDTAGNRVPVNIAWGRGTLSKEDYIKFRNEARTEYRYAPEFAGALDGVDPVRLPPELRGSPGVDQAQRAFNQMDLFDYSNEMDAFRGEVVDATDAATRDTRRMVSEAGGAPDSVVENMTRANIRARTDDLERPVRPDIVEKQTTNFPPDNLDADPSLFRKVGETIEDAPSQRALDNAIGWEESRLSSVAGDPERTMEPRAARGPDGLEIDEALLPENRPDPLRGRVLTEKGEALRRSLRKDVGGDPDDWMRLNQGGTLDEINAQANEMYSEYGIGDIFVPSPLDAVKIQGRQQFKSVAQQEFINEMVNSGMIYPIRVTDGVVSQETKDFAARAPRAGMSKESFGAGQSYWVDGRIKDDLIKTDLMFNRSDEMQAFGRFMEKFSGTWAAWATGALPRVSFHIRNAYGNIYLNYIRGVSNPRNYTDAMQVQYLGARATHVMKSTGVTFDEALASLTKDAPKRWTRYGRVLTSARAQGVINSSYFDELASIPGNEMFTGKLDKVIGRNNPLVKGGQMLGSTIEHNARLAHYINKLDSLGTPEAAAMSVKETLFDYNDLTQFEKTKLRTISRFYTFMRKNTALHMAVIARDPGRILNASRIYEAALVNDEGELSQDGLLDYQKRSGYVRGGESLLGDALSLGGLIGDGTAGSAISVDLPLSAAAETLSTVYVAGNLIPGLKELMPGEATGRGLTKGILGLTSGAPVALVTLLFEHSSGKDMFTDADIKDRGAEQNMMEMADVIAPIWSYYDRVVGQVTANEGVGPFGNNTASREDMELRHAVYTNLIGVTVSGLGDGSQERILTGYGFALEDALAALRERHPDEEIPTYSDLVAVGLLPEISYVDPGEGSEPFKDDFTRDGERIESLREFGFDVPDQVTADWENERVERDTYATTTEARLWGRENGFTVSVSGRLTYEVQKAFNEANPERPFLDPYGDLVRFEDRTEKSVFAN